MFILLSVGATQWTQATGKRPLSESFVNDPPPKRLHHVGPDFSSDYLQRAREQASRLPEVEKRNYDFAWDTLEGQSLFKIIIEARDYIQDFLAQHAAQLHFNETYNKLLTFTYHINIDQGPWTLGLTPLEVSQLGKLIFDDYFHLLLVDESVFLDSDFVDICPSKTASASLLLLILEAWDRVNRRSIDEPDSDDDIDRIPCRQVRTFAPRHSGEDYPSFFEHLDNFLVRPNTYVLVANVVDLSGNHCPEELEKFVIKLVRNGLGLERLNLSNTQLGPENLKRILFQLSERRVKSLYEVSFLNNERLTPQCLEPLWHNKKLGLKALLGDEVWDPDSLSDEAFSFEEDDEDEKELAPTLRLIFSDALAQKLKGLRRAPEKNTCLYSRCLSSAFNK